MKQYIKGQSQAQVRLLRECLDDYIADENPIRVVEAFVEQLDLVVQKFVGTTLAAAGRPPSPSVLLNIYNYGYLYRIQSSRRLERECQRNLELKIVAPDLSNSPAQSASDRTRV